MPKPRAPKTWTNCPRCGDLVQTGKPCGPCKIKDRYQAAGFAPYRFQTEA